MSTPTAPTPGDRPGPDGTDRAPWAAAAMVAAVSPPASWTSWSGVRAKP